MTVPGPKAAEVIAPSHDLTVPEAAGTDSVVITAIDHVGIAVPDLDAAIRFHTGVLGGVLTHREKNEEQGVDEAMIAFGDGPQVQLLARKLRLERSGPGLQQLAYRVPDVRAAGEQAAAAGIRTLYNEPRRGTGGSLINFLHPKDAGGVLVELVQVSTPADALPDTSSG
jgi:methylmalonyl-CoA/ethylmalonyl-CoA epimerase